VSLQILLSLGGTMSAVRKIRKKWLIGLAVSCLALAIALTHVPAFAGTSDEVNDGSF
jgi:hypothetical protein